LTRCSKQITLLENREKLTNNNGNKMKIEDMKEGVLFTFWGRTFIVYTVDTVWRGGSVSAEDIDNGERIDIPVAFLGEFEPLLS